MNKAFFAYIVECRDGTYYAGYTPDLKRRLKCHNDGAASKYTRSRRPVRLVWNRRYRDLSSALRAEHALKRLTREQKKLLIKGGGLLAIEDAVPPDAGAIK